jgi:hypothetical protein
MKYLKMFVNVKYCKEDEESNLHIAIGSNNPRK